jgi:hypothetical protein
VETHPLENSGLFAGVVVLVFALLIFFVLSVNICTKKYGH